MKERFFSALHSILSGTKTLGHWFVANLQNAVFTLGFLSIVVGCALIDTAMAFWLPGSIVCGLMILSRLLSARRTGGDSNA